MKKLFFCFFLLVTSFSLEGKERDYEINVVRPRFFVKKNRAEVAVDLPVVMNQTFTYSAMLSGSFAYHLTEYLALGVDTAYGLTFAKVDARLLEQEFDINIKTQQTNYFAILLAQWSPVYGKYQLSSGKLIYFDTFFLAGAGMSGVEFKGHGEKKDKSTIRKSMCGTMSFGVGQRFYLNKNLSLRWQLKNHVTHLDTVDDSCFPNEANSENSNYELTRALFNTIMLQVGVSYFF